MDKSWAIGNWHYSDTV